jgi:hypothetical protein
MTNVEGLMWRVEEFEDDWSYVHVVIIIIIVEKWTSPHTQPGVDGLLYFCKKKKRRKE